MPMRPFIIFLVFVSLLINEAASYSHNYGDAVDKSLLFFEAQRSGKLPRDQRTQWRGDSGLNDGYQQGVDLVGGYYDAGDHVKFGLPMAYTVTMLAWGAIEFGKEMTDLNQMGHALEAIKWGTDYFMKAHTEDDVFWAQVGDGDSDHYCWERAEDMTTPRTGYRLDRNSPGSDVAGETAAALAAAALAFKLYNSSYSNLLISHAQQLFSFADRVRGLYVDSISNANQYYASSGYSDELLWGATWLYKATGDQYYLNYVIENGEYMGGTGWAMKEFSWDNKYAGVQILMSEVLLQGKGANYIPTLRQYQAKANYFACACVMKNGGYNIEKTPAGLMYVREWNNMQYVSASAFLLAVYSQYLAEAKATVQCPDADVKPLELLQYAKSQADYILGDNPESISYLVGYGEKFPVHVHHRGSSIASVYDLRAPVQCAEGFEMWYHRPQKNPNIIYGALVGGPDSTDKYSDDRSDYEQTEPTISGTAPLVGLFSKLNSDFAHKGYSSKPPVSRQPYKGNRVPVQIVHGITKTWKDGSTTFNRHKVALKNISKFPIVNLRLRIENLIGKSWGLRKSSIKDIYLIAQRMIKPGYAYTFVYVQGGPQAKISVEGFDRHD